MITIPIEIDLTPRSRAVMDALYKALSTEHRTDDGDATRTTADLTLQPGERYAGVVLDENGKVMHHLILMTATLKKLNWQAALDWAKEAGGALPTRQELSLLFANCKPHLSPVWHWSSDVHEADASFAWDCYFDHGYIYDYLHKSCEGSAVAVRRLIP